MDWDLQAIRARMRKLTGRLDSNVVDDDELDDEINAYYQHQFPDEVDVREFESFLTFDTVAGTDEYDQPDTVKTLERPLTIKDSDDNVYPLELYTSPVQAELDYPDDAHDEADEQNRPEALLLMGRKYLLRPVPDDVYTVKYFSTATQPTALTDDGDAPPDDKWGPAIAYGASIEYLQAHGQNDEADELKDLYTYYVTSIARKQLRQIPLGQRALPSY